MLVQSIKNCCNHVFKKEVVLILMMEMSLVAKLSIKRGVPKRKKTEHNRGGNIQE